MTSKVSSSTKPSPYVSKNIVFGRKPSCLDRTCDSAVEYDLGTSFEMSSSRYLLADSTHRLLRLFRSCGKPFPLNKMLLNDFITRTLSYDIIRVRDANIRAAHVPAPPAFYHSDEIVIVRTTILK